LHNADHLALVEIEDYVIAADAVRRKHEKKVETDTPGPAGAPTTSEVGREPPRHPYPPLNQL